MKEVEQAQLVQLVVLALLVVLAQPSRSNLRKDPCLLVVVVALV